MAKKHGAKQQKKAAKKKAQKNARKSELGRRSSKDPSVRFRGCEAWPVHAAYRSKSLWEDGIGYIVLVRRASASQLIVVNYLVDVLCLGVKDVHWGAETSDSLAGYLAEVEERVPLTPISPACAVKIVREAVEFAAQYGLPPAADFKHTKLLLDGIDASTCTEEFAFGRDGKPFFVQGPFDTPEKVRAILSRIGDDGHSLVGDGGSLSLRDLDRLANFDPGEPEFDDDELDDDFDDEEIPPSDDDIVVG